MADTSKLLLLAAAGAAVYYFYFYSPNPAAATTTTTAAPPPPPPNPNAITGANTLDGIYARLVNTPGGATRGVDQWDYALGPLLPPGDVSPDPMPLFSAAVPGFDRSQLVTAGQYWAVMAPALKSAYGLSGLGVMGQLHVWRGW